MRIIIYVVNYECDVCLLIIESVWVVLFGDYKFVDVVFGVVVLLFGYLIEVDVIVVVD